MYCIKCGEQTNNSNSICPKCQKKSNPSLSSRSIFLFGRFIMVLLTGIAAIPFYLIGFFAILMSLAAEDSIFSLLYFPVLIIKCFVDYPLDTFVTVFMWIAPMLQNFGVFSAFIHPKKDKKKISFKADIYFIISALCLIYYNHSKNFLGFMDSSIEVNFLASLGTRKAISISLIIFAIIDLISIIITKKSLEELDTQNLEQINPNQSNNNIEQINSNLLNNNIEPQLSNNLNVCPFCHAPNQTNNYCEYCGQKLK